MLLGSEAVLSEEGLLAQPEDLAEDPLSPLLRRIRGGDLEAFADLMAHTEGRVLGLAWRLLGDRHLAEDAAQETWLRVFRSLDRFRLGEPFQPWLLRITVNACRDQMRKRGPLPLPAELLERLEGNAQSLAADEAVLVQQRRALLQRALVALPEAQRAALVLRDLEGLSTEEAARILGVRPVTIRSQAATARARLRAACAILLQPAKGGRP